MASRRICKHCKAVNTLVTDYQRGEVACTSCAVVAEAGLVEDSATAWDEDNTHLEEGRGETTVAGKAARRSDEDRAVGRVVAALQHLQERTAVPAAAVSTGKDYAEQFLRLSRARNNSGTNPAVVAAACFLLAAAKAQHPVQRSELLALPRVKASVSAGRLDEMHRRVVRDLGLEAEVRDAAAVAPLHLAAMYLRRARVRPVRHLPDLVAALVAAYYDTVESGRALGPLVAAMCTFALVGGPVRAVLREALPVMEAAVASAAGEVTEANAQRLTDDLTRASREADGAVAAVLSSLGDDQHRALAAAVRTPLLRWGQEASAAPPEAPQDPMPAPDAPGKRPRGD